MNEHKDTEKDVEEVSLEIEDDKETSDSSEESIEPAKEEVPEIDREAELVDKLQRLQAEFDNFRKRMDNRFAEITKYASEGIVLKILDMYDNILRALDVDFSADPEAAKQGIQAIKQQFDKVLAQEDVRSIESLGKPFDPYYHNAINRKSDPDQEEGIILEVYQTGYMIRERVLRPAIVCVNRIEVPVKDDQSIEAEKQTS